MSEHPITRDDLRRLYEKATGDARTYYCDSRVQAVLSALDAYLDQPHRTESEIKAEALREAAAEFDHSSAQRAAEDRVRSVRCDSCELRYDQRDQYGCVTSLTPHSYSEVEFDEARQLDVEPTWTGARLRNRADALLADVTAEGVAS